MQWIGKYDTEIQAVMAYDAVARERRRPTNLPPHTYGQAVNRLQSSAYSGVSWHAKAEK